MAFAIILIAAGLIASGIRGTYKQLGSLITGDFTGSNNFFVWLIAIGCVGALGYVPKLQQFSRVFFALILVVMFVRQGSGLFAQFSGALQGAQATPGETSPGATVDGGSGSSTGPGNSLVGGSVGNAIDGTLNGLGGAGTASSIGSIFSSLPDLSSFLPF